MSEKPDLGQVAEALGGMTAETSASMTAEEKKYASDQKAFEGLEKKYQGKKEEEAAPPKKKAAKKSTSEKVSEEPRVTEEKKDVGSDLQETPESQKAREFLKLKASAPAAVIEALSPEEAVEWHSAVARRESEIDRTHRELAEMRKQSEEREAVEQSEHDAVPAEELDLSDFTTRLSEQLGDEPAKALAEGIKELLDQRDERITLLEQTIRQSQQNNARSIVETQKDRLTEYMPEGVDFDVIVQRAVQLEQGAPEGTYPSSVPLFDKAMKDIYGSKVFETNGHDEEEPVTEPEPQATEDERAQIQASTPSTQSRKKAPRKLSGKESDWKVFDSLEKDPGNIRAAQRAGQLKK